MTPSIPPAELIDERRIVREGATEGYIVNFYSRGANALATSWAVSTYRIDAVSVLAAMSWIEAFNRKRNQPWSLGALSIGHDGRKEVIWLAGEDLNEVSNDGEPPDSVIEMREVQSRGISRYIGWLSDRFGIIETVD